MTDDRQLAADRYLRDMFAMQAMELVDWGNTSIDPAFFCYNMADLMMKERARRDEQPLEFNPRG